MAYWNPQKQGDNYYDPYYQSQEPGPSAGQALMGMAKTMAVIGVLNFVGGAATRALSGKAGQAIAKYSKGGLGSIARNMKSPTIGGIIGRTNTFKSITAPLKRTSIYKASQTRARQLSTLKGKPGYGLARVTTAFKNPKTFLAATAGVWKQNVLSGIGVAYGVDSLLGITHRDLGLEKKKWYDLPGQASNFGRWLVTDSVAGLAMGAVTRMGGALGSAGYLGMKRAFGGKFGERVMEVAAQVGGRAAIDKDIQYRTRGGSQASIFNQVAQAGIRSAQERKASSNIVTKALHFAQKIPDVMRSANAAIKVAPNAFNSAQGNFGVRTKKALNVVNSAIKGAAAAADSRTKPVRPETGLSGLRALQAVHQLGLDAVAEPAKGEFIPLITPTFEENFLNKIKHANNKKSFMQEVFGFLKPLRNQDVVDKNFWEETAGSLTNRYRRSEVDTLLGHIKNMRVGSDIYVGTRAVGGGVDLSVFNPVLAMKRGASVVANARFRIPLSNWDFTIGDMTGISAHLSEQPSFEFFKKRPAVAINDPRIDQVDVASLSKEGENPLFWYMNGAWASFDGATVNSVQTDSLLKYAPQTSRAKKRQLRSVNLKRWEAHARSMATDDQGNIDFEKAAGLFNMWKQKWDHREAPTNKFLHFLNTKLNMTVPGIVNRMASAVENSLGGTAKKYQLAAAYAEGAGEWIPGKAWAGLPFIEEAYKSGSQVFSRILHNKHALDRIGMESGARMKDDLLGIAFNNAHLSKALDEIDWTAARYQGRGDFQRAVEDIRVNPSYARSHHAVKRMGDLSEMTSYDIARVNLIEDRLNDNYDIFSGNGKEHPVLKALPALLRAGDITPKEANALSLWGKLSAFRDKSLFKHTGDPDGATIKGEWLKTLARIRDSAKEQNWNLEQEMLTFAKDFDLKHPGIRASQARMLRDNKEIPEIISDTSPYVSVRKGFQGILDIARNATDSTTDLLSEFMPVAKREFSHHGIRGNLKYVGNIVGLAAGAGLLYRTADTLVATSPLLEDTPFDDGITGASADVIARARLGLAHVGDLTGITPAMKYLHGLAPKSESFVPGAFLGTVAGMTFGGPLKAMKFAAVGGLVNRIASPYLPDLTKSHSELEKIYSGEDMVPIFKSPTWLLGGTPWEGTKVAGYQPNWYVRAKSRYEESGTLYGSAFRRLIHKPLPLLGTNIGDLVDPYYMERQHFFSRPYPTTGKAFGEIPLIGGLLSSTIGRIVKPEKTMHQEFLYADTHTQHGPSENSPFAITPPSYGTAKTLMATKSPIRSTAGIANSGGEIILPAGKAWSETAAEDFLYDVRNFAGLRGFMAGAVSERIFGRETVIPTLQQAGRMASMSREFYDKNLGGMGVITEPIRRLIDKPEYRQYGINPIPNLMPNWLPARFTTGDPYEKILKGELRLPGQAYSRTHPNLRRTMPGRASMFGGQEEHIVQYFTGLLPPVLKEEYDIMETGTDMHAQIQDHLQAEGLLVSCEDLVIDVKNDITGHIDAIIRDGQGGKGRRALEIKTIGEEALATMDGPKWQHVGQLNFYLRQLGLKNGTILYVARENPAAVRTFEVRYSENRFQSDLRKLKKARQVAADMMQEGVADTYGHSYSWLDRLGILADVAPASKEFGEAKKIVQSQMKAGLMTQDEITEMKKYISHRQARLRTYELYPDRFRGQLFSPSAQYNAQSINEDIKAAAEYSLPERAIGWIWEHFANSNNILSNKLFAVKDPLEHYQMTRLYGKEYKPWNEPIRSWIEPYSRGLASKTNPLEGALSFGTGGFVFGGPAGAILGGVGGSLYGAAHGLYRFTTGSRYIPNAIDDRREIDRYFDVAKYERLGRMAALSDGLTRQNILEAQASTLTAINAADNSSVANLFRATPYTEKPYIEAFLNERDPSKRQEILNFVPKDLGMALSNQWGKHDESINTQRFVDNTSIDIAAGRKSYAFNDQILDPRINLEDIKLKTVESRGYDAHEFGLGWNEQMLRMQNSFNDIQDVHRAEYNTPPTAQVDLNSSQVRGAILSLLHNNGLKGSANVYINNGREGPNAVTIKIRRDRALSVVRALRNRDRYMNG